MTWKLSRTRMKATSFRRVRVGALGRLDGARCKCPGCEQVAFGGGEGCGHSRECGTGAGAWIVWAYRNFADTTNIGCPR